MDVLTLVTNPLALTLLSATAFGLSFGMLLMNVNLNTVYSGSVKVGWWGGTVITSMVALLSFYICFNTSPHFNAYLVVLAITTLLIVHTALILNQLNMTIV
uniref:Uncharacterized protein n=1 Tax=viral metagenome TaxID=1070528 RepID=A0A6C0L912_9ZZZZ